MLVRCKTRYYKGLDWKHFFPLRERARVTTSRGKTKNNSRDTTRHGPARGLILLSSLLGQESLFD